MKKGLVIKYDDKQEKVDMNYERIEGFNSSERLQSIYNLLGVDLIDIVDHDGYSIYVDDEALLKEETKLTLVIPDSGKQIFGNVLILGDVDEEGNSKGLSIDEVNKLLGQMRIVHDETIEHEFVVW